MAYRLGWDADKQNMVLREYATLKGIPVPDKTASKGTRKVFYMELALIIQSGDWQAFYDTTLKHKRGKAYPQQRQSYSQWWQQSNMDGSFAYNGVTDDF